MSKHQTFTCPYSGQTLPIVEGSFEHVIPRSLGGKKGRGEILVARKINSDLGAHVDGALSKDIQISWARLRAGSRAASGKTQTIRNLGYYGLDAVQDYFDASRKPTHLFASEWEGHQGVRDLREATDIESPLSRHAFIFEANLEHVARLKFVIKVLLGFNALFFLGSLVECVDVPELQALLLTGLQKEDSRKVIVTEGVGQNGIGFSHAMLPCLPVQEIKQLEDLKRVLEVGRQCRVHFLETEEFLICSVAVLGVLVGSLSVPIRQSLFGKLYPGHSALFVLGSTGFTCSSSVF